MNGPLVVDASVAVKWVLAESDSELTQQIVHSSLLAPDLLLIECGNAIWRHVQLGELDPAEMSQLWAVLRAMPVEIVASQELVERAIDLAVALSHPIYDCLYLALALAERAQLVTADRRFVEAVRRHGAPAGAIALLAETAH